MIPDLSKRTRRFRSACHDRAATRVVLDLHPSTSSTHPSVVDVFEDPPATIAEDVLSDFTPISELAEPAIAEAEPLVLERVVVPNHSDHRNQSHSGNRSSKRNCACHGGCEPVAIRRAPAPEPVDTCARSRSCDQEATLRALEPKRMHAPPLPPPRRPPAGVHRHPRRTQRRSPAPPQSTKAQSKRKNAWLEGTSRQAAIERDAANAETGTTAHRHRPSRFRCRRSIRFPDPFRQNAPAPTPVALQPPAPPKPSAPLRLKSRCTAPNGTDCA